MRSGDKKLAVVTRCLAYGTVVGVPFALHNRYVEQRTVADSLRSENAASRHTVLFDRLPHFEIDNAMIVGGLVSDIFLSWAALTLRMCSLPY